MGISFLLTDVRNAYFFESYFDMTETQIVKQM